MTAMRMREAVRVFETTKDAARGKATWRLRLWAHIVRRRLENHSSEANQIKLVAIQHELNHR